MQFCKRVKTLNSWMGRTVVSGTAVWLHGESQPSVLNIHPASRSFQWRWWHFKSKRTCFNYCLRLLKNVRVHTLGSFPLVWFALACFPILDFSWSVVIAICSDQLSFHTLGEFTAWRSVIVTTHLNNLLYVPVLEKFKETRTKCTLHIDRPTAKRTAWIRQDCEKKYHRKHKTNQQRRQKDLHLIRWAIHLPNPGCERSSTSRRAKMRVQSYQMGKFWKAS